MSQKKLMPKTEENIQHKVKGGKMTNAIWKPGLYGVKCGVLS